MEVVTVRAAVDDEERTEKPDPAAEVILDAAADAAAIPNETVDAAVEDSEVAEEDDYYYAMFEADCHRNCCYCYWIGGKNWDLRDEQNAEVLKNVVEREDDVEEEKMKEEEEEKLLKELPF